MNGSRKKKPREVKYRVHNEKKREEYGLAVAIAILIVVLFISGFLINSMLDQPSTSQTFSSTSQPKAVIVDHLSLTRPNQTFIETATNILKQANYSVDYYSGNKVDVEFYRILPTHGYSIIVLRIHSALKVGSDQKQGSLGLFTSEIYSSTKYVYEQLNDQVLAAQFPYKETKYFAISPLFVLHCMNGRFQDTKIIMMGCDGLTYTGMAQAFVEKGAKVYIGWDGSILGTRNDPAITLLLRHLITEKQTIKDAIAHTTKEYQPSRKDNSMLKYYPLEAGTQRIENIKNDG